MRAPPAWVLFLRTHPGETRPDVLLPLLFLWTPDAIVLQAQPLVEETMLWHLAGESTRDDVLRNLPFKYLTEQHFQSRRGAVSHVSAAG